MAAFTTVIFTIIRAFSDTNNTLCSNKEYSFNARATPCLSQTISPIANQ